VVANTAPVFRRHTTLLVNVPPVMPPRQLLDVRRIYVEPEAADLPRGKDVLARYPEAEHIAIDSHWRIPELFGDESNAERWVRIKTESLVLGVKKSLAARPNGRSSDLIAPSTANGCAMACSYCYVPRRKGYSNPITVFANIDRITGYVARHVGRQGTKPEPNQCDPLAWVYDIGENSDCSVDATVSDNVRDLVELFRDLPTAKASFATKWVNRELLDWDPQGRTRVRFSLMPEQIAKVVDVRTSSVQERIAAIDDFVAAGYEVHLNFSPVIVHEGWLAEWSALLDQVDAGIGPAARQQLACEVIFLTHNERLHETNLAWHPKGEELLWRPDLQQRKWSQNGDLNVRYKTTWKSTWVAQLVDLIEAKLPYCRVRYAF
jgi:spore photoproduct lyase family protein